MTDELKPVRCGCGGETWAFMTLYPENPERPYICQCRNCFTRTGGYPTESDAITAWNRAMSAKDINVPNKFATDKNVGDKERTAKATRKPEAFFYRCECGYGLCCEKNDMNYCPNCGGRLEWE